MNDSQRLIINILKNSLNNKKSEIYLQKMSIWNKVIKFAREHEISSLIYYLIERSSLKCIDKHILNSWKADVIKSNMSQLKIESEINKIICGFNKMKIKIVLLKGLILKNYYLKPELRTMGDGDILIQEKDYKKAEKYLLEEGYALYKEKNSVHQGFINENGILIELHWKLINNENYIADTEEFENNIWNRCVCSSIYGEYVYSLNNEDFLLHLFIHMAKHIRASGFGLRHLYDIALFIKRNYESIKWEEFYFMAKKNNALKFSKGILLIINDIFEVKIPREILNDNTIKKSDLNLLLEWVLSHGVFGVNNIINGLTCVYMNRRMYKNNIKLKSETVSSAAETKMAQINIKKSRILRSVELFHEFMYIIFIKYGIINFFRNFCRSLINGEKKIKILNRFNL